MFTFNSNPVDRACVPFRSGLPLNHVLHNNIIKIPMGSTVAQIPNHASSAPVYCVSSLVYCGQYIGPNLPIQPPHRQIMTHVPRTFHLRWWPCWGHRLCDPCGSSPFPSCLQGWHAASCCSPGTLKQTTINKLGKQAISVTLQVPWKWNTKMPSTPINKQNKGNKPRYTFLLLSRYPERQTQQ